jgi:hypothetical protein
MMTETNGFVETFATLELEGNAFFSAVLLDNLCGDARSINDGSSNLGVFTIVHEKNLGELNLVVSTYRKLVDTDRITFLNAVLFTAGFENCVGHGCSLAKN